MVLKEEVAVAKATAQAQAAAAVVEKLGCESCEKGGGV